MFTEAQLDVINSATKYPSIPTYHALDNGMLTNVPHPVADVSLQDIVVTEKIDGSNARLIVQFSDGRANDVFIGSREMLLRWPTADSWTGPEKVDPVAINIRMVLSNTADDAAEWKHEDVSDIIGKRVEPGDVLVIYGEAFGKGFRKGGNYTAGTRNAFSAFDVLFIPREVMVTLQEHGKENASRWRQNGHQKFLSLDVLARLKETGAFGTVPLIPISDLCPRLPNTWDECMEFLEMHVPRTRALIDRDYRTSQIWKGASEGVIVRTKDRAIIAKMRFEDYRSAKRKSGKQRKHESK